jgi:cardiolipin synthase (CMP-forming)
MSTYASLPNLITLTRLGLVPVVIAMISAGRWQGACFLFILAGLSDAVDGWLAKSLNLRTELGAYLDPLADKALLVSIYVALAVAGALPSTLAIVVVARDVMIIGAFMISWFMDKRIKIRPLLISKINTAAQIAFATAVLGAKAFQFTLVRPWIDVAAWGVAALTLASLAAYLASWSRHMSL